MAYGKRATGRREEEIRATGRRPAGLAWWQISALPPSTLRGSVYSVMSLLMALLIWSPVAAAAAAPTCVVKLKFSSGDKSDSGTNAFVRQVLSGQGYNIIDDWLFTLWSRSDFDVKIIITHTEVPNYGFPVSLMEMDLFIADSSGKVLVNGYVDRSDLEDELRALVPACNTSPPSTPLSDSGSNAPQ
jgi:hypothetical protein